MPPTSAYLNFSDRLADRMIRWGIPWRAPCTKTEKASDNVAVVTPLPAAQCYKMGPQKHLRGIWRFGTDGNWLCAASAKFCSYETAPYVADFEVRVPADLIQSACPGDLYAIDFVGRTTDYPHDLTRKAIVTVNRIISIKQIEAAGCTRNDGTLK